MYLVQVMLYISIFLLIASAHILNTTSALILELDSRNINFCKKYYVESMSVKIQNSEKQVYKNIKLLKKKGVRL